MTALVPPRYELPLLDPVSGRMTREWYKFLVQMSKSIGPSTTSTEDLQLFESADVSDIESRIGVNRKIAQDALGYVLYMSDDLAKPQDISLLAWWPGEAK